MTESKEKRCHPSRSRGFNLVEVMVGLGIFSMISVSIIGLTFWVRVSTEEAVYNNTALTLAQAYLEQMRSSDFATLRTAANDTTAPLGLLSTTGSALTDEGGGVMNNGNWARETIMLDEDENGQERQPLTFRFRPVLVDLNAATAGAADGVEIVIIFQSTYNFGQERTHHGSLRTVRSNVATY